MSELKVIAHSKIDFKKWDKAVLKSPFPLVFAQSFYLNATCPNWKAIVLNNYEVIFPITEGNKLKIKYLFQPSFTPQLGIYGLFTIKDQVSIFNYLIHKYKFIEIELNASNTFKSKSLNEKQTFIIDYDKPYKINENTKRNISKAKKSGLTICEINDFKEAYKLAKGKLVPWLKSELDLPLKQGTLLLDLISNADNNNSLKVFKAVDEGGNILSIGYFVFNKFHAVYLKGMSFNKKDKSGSMHLLMNEAISFFKDKVKIFDFGGGASAGLAGFYAGLGGSKLIYHTFKVNNLPWPLKMIKK